MAGGLTEHVSLEQTSQWGEGASPAMIWGKRAPTRKNREIRAPETRVGNSETAGLLLLRKQVA